MDKIAITAIVSFTIIVVLYVIFSTGEKNTQPSISEKAHQACIDAGGVPIMSSWSSQLADCKFPPK